MQSYNNLKQIGLAAHVFHDKHLYLPMAGTILPDGRLGHSWATQMLPYLEQSTLYEKINLDKPWTDAENRVFFETILDPFRSYMVSRKELHNAAGYALSFYAVNERVLPVGEKVTFDSITDGTSNTILCGEVKGNVRAWGDPINGRDPAWGINKTPYGFGSYFSGGANMGFCDGAVRFVTDTIDPEVLRALATPDGGEEATL